MDFSRLADVDLDFTSNADISKLPSKLLEAFIPGYSLISSIILSTLGFDIGLVVFGCFVLLFLGKGLKHLWKLACSFFSDYFICSIQMDEDDELHYSVLRWISEQPVAKLSRDLKAITKYLSNWDEDEDGFDEQEILDSSGIFNYDKWASQIPPQYEPNYGKHRFWFQGRLFWFDRFQRARKGVRLYGSSEEDIVEISCIGRGTRPIKELLFYIKKWGLEKEKKMTRISRPAAKEERGGGYPWIRVSSRPSRPMTTVSLDQEQKAMIVRDVNEYLHPNSSKWYATRGIPYRRGYLFHGPPGTGKTSLSFALAGIFGLDIYCISLMEAGLTESDLSKMFNTLPRRCIVLLEDIDAAGLRRADDKKDDQEKNRSEKSEVDSGYSEGEKEGENRCKCKVDSKKSSKKKEKKKDKDDEEEGADGNKKARSLISLSGLLNAIDGVATHEGRVLIMTTNHPEKLDAALIRPGRVDLQIRFTLAKKDQIRDIFTRMYTVEEGEKEPTVSSRPSTPGTSESTERTSFASTASSSEDKELFELVRSTYETTPTSNEELRDLADRFAESLEEDTFSPAEIQGFLLMRKKEPRKAVRDVAAWRNRLLEAKTKGEKVVDL